MTATIVKATKHLASSLFAASLSAALSFGADAYAAAGNVVFITHGANGTSASYLKSSVGAYISTKDWVSPSTAPDSNEAHRAALADADIAIVASNMNPAYATPQEQNIKDFLNRGGLLIVTGGSQDWFRSLGLLDASSIGAVDSASVAPADTAHYLWRDVPYFNTSNVTYYYRVSDPQAINLATTNSSGAIAISKPFGSGQILLVGSAFYNESPFFGKVIANAIENHFGGIPTNCKPTLQISMEPTKAKAGSDFKLSSAIAHPCEIERSIELKLWRMTPERSLQSLVSGAYSIALQPNEDFTDTNIISTSPNEKAGFYGVGVRITDVVTGETLAEATKTFEVTTQ